MNGSRMRNWVSVGILFAVGLARAAGLPGDAEAMAHGDEAAIIYGNRVRKNEAIFSGRRLFGQVARYHIDFYSAVVRHI